MRLNTAWLGLAAGVYVAAALALFPAGTAYRWFAPPALNAVGIEGSVWRGRAALASINGLFKHPLTDIGIQKFMADWEAKKNK